MKIVNKITHWVVVVIQCAVFADKIRFITQIEESASMVIVHQTSVIIDSNHQIISNIKDIAESASQLWAPVKQTKVEWFVRCATNYIKSLGKSIINSNWIWTGKLCIGRRSVQNVSDTSIP